MSPRRPSARPDPGGWTAPHGSAGRPSLTGDGLRLGDRTVPLHAGSVQYFRLDRAHWRPALRAVRDLGLGMIETYAPWGVHERDDGSYDFGQGDPRLDLRAFLDLAAELELLVFLRPGPHVNAELALFGLPARVVYDERNQARSPRGNPLPLPAPPRFFPVPSYASQSFRQQTREWFRVLGEQVRDQRWPDGPVALLQVDNEAAFYFRDGPYDADYHPDAIAAFRRHLQAKYGHVEQLNAVWRSEHASFDDVDAPRQARVRERRDLPARLDWVEFQQALICDSLAEMRADLAELGFGGLPTVHNLPMGEAGLATSLHAVGRVVDLVGLDYYHGRGGLDRVRRKTLRLGGATTLPFAPELGVGAPPWFGPRTDRDAIFSALCAFAFGLRAFNLYMAVDRDRWMGAPIAASGEPRRRSARRWRRLLEALERVELHRLRRPVQVAISLPREYALLTRATHTLGAISPSALDVAGLPESSACGRDTFGFAEPIQLAWTKQVWRLDRALSEEQVPFVYLEGEADLERHPELKLIFAPTYELASPERIEALRRFEQRGGTVVWGPELPSLDTRLQPRAFRPPGERPALRLSDQSAAERLVQGLVDELALERPFPVSPRPLLSSVHRDGGEARVVFLVNPGEADVRAEVQLPAPLSAHDPLSDERFEGSPWRVPMAGRSARMLVIDGSEGDGDTRTPAERRKVPSARARRRE